MLTQDLFNIVVGVLLSIGGWLARQLWDAVQQLKNDVNDLEVELPSKYIAKSEFNERWIEVLSALRRIENKLDTKADK